MSISGHLPFQEGRQESEILDVAVADIVYESADKAFAVLSVKPEGGGATLRAAGPVAGVAPGESLRLRGRHIQHPKHGLQFEVESFEPLEPRTKRGVIKLLGSGLVKGVGQRVAERIVKRLGLDTLRVIIEEPAQLKKVRGVGDKLAERIHNTIVEHRAEVEALAFLRSYGLGSALARKVYATYGKETQDLLGRDPYRIAEEIRGVGFLTADRIARELGIQVEAPVRAEAALLHLLAKGRDDGHVALPLSALVSQAERMDVSEAGAELAVARLADRRAVVIDEHLVYLPPLHTCETRFAQLIVPLASLRKKPRRAEEVLDRVCGRLAQEQRKAVEATLDRGLVVITGGPGTGKTTTLRAVVALHEALGRDVALAAPTGRAARRLSEVTGRPAKTIHRLLDYHPVHGFQLGRANPITAEVVVVDEASMVDVVLAYRLACAIPEGATLLLVGDVDQLPSVGPGTVLRDLIDSKVPAVRRLEHVFRQAAQSAIVLNAHRVNKGEPPQSGKEGDFHVVGARDPDRAMDMLARIVSERIPKAFGLDPIDDVQVLAPMYRGTLGCDAINELLREKLNPHGRRGVRGFRAGDKVMQMRNDYDKEVFNGDVGRVASVSLEQVIVDIEGRGVEYTEKEAEDLRLAFCVTVHKSQGSEYPAAVIVLHGQHHVMLARNLLYTGITRGKKLVVLLGAKEAMARAAAYDPRAIRHGRLQQRLEEHERLGAQAR